MVHSRFFFHMDYWNITNQMEYGEVGALYPSHHRCWCEHKPPKQETINRHRQCYMPLQVCKQRHFPFHLQCFEHLLHHGTRGLPLNTSLWVTISSGTLFWIMLFSILMPGIKGTVQLRFQTSFLVYILTPLAIQFAKGVELGWCRFKPTVLVFLGQQVLPETITGTN
ncbi:hypothetical protein PVAP13_2NG301803 [Panicum virgatum]|uniref:Uncharacterized protein n=1 Tax=Panicum virgatum TaxID=38727 RepID=A0A8T0V925_PANVG|nr:hypothetical protein PVAP13_2NG301803 [Panicum virgatum]